MAAMLEVQNNKIHVILIIYTNNNNIYFPKEKDSL